MSKKSKGGDGGEKLVPIKRLPGPLSPWRLSLSVAVTAVTTGLPLIHAAQTGDRIDIALARSFAIGFLTWFLLGRINRVLVQAALDRAAAPATGSSSITELPPSAATEQTPHDTKAA